MNLVKLLNITRPLVGLDLETTGTHKNIDRIVQIGIVKLYPNGDVKTYEQVINPGIKIPEEASNVHGISDTVAQDAPTFPSIADVLLKGFDNCDFAGYNLHAFDLPFLQEEFARCGKIFKPGFIVDGFRIFQRMYPRNLEAAVNEYLELKEVDRKRFDANIAWDTLKQSVQNGHERMTFHDALSDVKASLLVIEAQLERHPELPRNVEALHNMFFRASPGQLTACNKIVWRDGEAVLNFGQKAGMSLRKVPRDYLQWMMKGTFSDEVKSIVDNALMGRFPVKS